ncbi:hypothetical protein GTQ40_10420 [Flavobacteriaceae bacterium R38]|nr:hypothetical protein [Flavobacteriaceae bacterium R38]
MKKLVLLTTLLLLSATYTGFSQEDDEAPQQKESNLLEFTPSKLLYKGQVDIKWFNNLFTTTTFVNEDGDKSSTGGRQNFFTSSLEVFFGVSESRRVNIGFITEFRSNTIGGGGVFDVFKFDGETGVSRSGLTAIAPAIKWQPFKKIPNFSILHAFSIPLVDNEVEQNVFLDEKTFVIQNRFFYDYTFSGDKFQFFADLNTELNLGEDREFFTDANGFFNTSEGGFANNSLRVTYSGFLSYFPTPKWTLQLLSQQFFLIDLGNDFDQNFTTVGAGIKYQLTDDLSLETLYTNFFRARDANTGQTFNIGLRVIL